MGEVIAQDLLAQHHLSGLVTSAGTTALDGVEATDRAQQTVRRRGLDLSSHLSRRVTAAMVADADLVLAMERRHIMDLTNKHGAALLSTYTVAELAELAAHTPRHRGERTTEWLRRAAAGRTATSALAAPEIDDPIGRSMRRYRAAASSIAHALELIVIAYGAGSDH